jgi:DNA-binding NtrC family response regulator
MRVLLVEDDAAVRITVRDALEEAGHSVAAHADGATALSAAEREQFDLLLTDVRLPGLDGVNLFRRVHASQPGCTCILMTAFGQVNDAVEVMREGANDYITKPFEMEDLLGRVQKIGAEHAFRSVLADEAPSDEEKAAVERLVGSSPAMRQVLERMQAAAAACVNVMITGETGTGKGVCARALHRMSARAGGPFVEVNCAAIPSELLEAEMFGHEKGAFTGAVRRREGRMAAAGGGTLFLDEIGELTLEHQAKLLRALESGRFEPVGSDASVRADFWLIAATNRDLREQVSAKAFRQDLYFRINVIEVGLPPLRQRRNDIPLLVSDLLRDATERRHMPMPSLSSNAIAALMTYDYPGNVRELRHALEHGLAMCKGGEMDVAHLPQGFQSQDLAGLAASSSLVSLPEAVRQFEMAYIHRVLEQVGGKRGEAARVLGISRKSLWQKLRDGTG